VLRIYCSLICLTLAFTHSAADVAADSKALDTYRAALAALRQEGVTTRALPPVRFFLFGMGHRKKLIYRDGRLLDASNGSVVREWKITRDWIVPSEYAVALETGAGAVRIFENEEAVWVEQNGERTALDATRSVVKLPRFEDNRHAPVLRVLHQELLWNITPQGPVPNLFVYPKPWYRDGAMMALAFQETGNATLLHDWILKLSEPYDRNNAGITEPDNLGQALYLLSLASDKNHALVTRILAEAKKFEKSDSTGRWIEGKSDFALHPVYQTKWLKYGLAALKLDDPYTIPLQKDGYSALFWMAYKDRHDPTSNSNDRGPYAYLGWACDHFYGEKKSPLSDQDYPLTWEQNASQAHYEGLRVLDPVYVQKKISAPHTWHAAEAFLYLLKDGAKK